MAENSGLSLRTIQRIENGETESRGDTLTRLANALDVAPEELMNWELTEDKGFLMSLNLSALGFILFLLLGIVIPLIMWISKEGKLKQPDNLAKEVLKLSDFVNHRTFANLHIFYCIYLLSSKPGRRYFSFCS